MPALLCRENRALTPRCITLCSFFLFLAETKATIRHEYKPSLPRRLYWTVEGFEDRNIIKETLLKYFSMFCVGHKTGQGVLNISCQSPWSWLLTIERHGMIRTQSTTRQSESGQELEVSLVFHELLLQLKTLMYCNAFPNVAVTQTLGIIAPITSNVVYVTSQ